MEDKVARLDKLNTLWDNSVCSSMFYMVIFSESGIKCGQNRRTLQMELKFKIRNNCGLAVVSIIA